MSARDIVLGVDPGLTGALCFWHRRCDITIVADMPVREIQRGGKSRHDVDVTVLAQLVAKHAPSVRLAMIEKVQAMPVRRVGADGKLHTRSQGAQSAFVFGRGAGLVEGVIAAHGIPILFAEPALWKRVMRVTSDKSTSLRMATALSPGDADKWRLAKHHGRAEAYLLARYGEKFAAHQDGVGRAHVLSHESLTVDRAETESSLRSSEPDTLPCSTALRRGPTAAEGEQPCYRHR